MGVMYSMSSFVVELFRAVEHQAQALHYIVHFLFCGPTTILDKLDHEILYVHSKRSEYFDICIVRHVKF